MMGCWPVEMWRWLEGSGEGRGRKTWSKCVNDDMKLVGLNGQWQYSGIC